jgi:anti-sigma regulatory factor (Ser/Thr protein kinase)
VDDEIFEIDLDPVKQAAADARRATRLWLGEASLPGNRFDDLLIVVSELVSNAVIHARTRLRLVIRYDGRHLLTEVFDGDPQLPVPPDHPGDVGGRGLFLVDRLSHRCGSEAVGVGKRVWAEFAMPSSGHSPAAL